MTLICLPSTPPLALISSSARRMPSSALDAERGGVAGHRGDVADDDLLRRRAGGLAAILIAPGNHNGDAAGKEQQRDQSFHGHLLGVHRLTGYGPVSNGQRFGPPGAGVTPSPARPRRPAREPVRMGRGLPGSRHRNVAVAPSCRKEHPHAPCAGGNFDQSRLSRLHSPADPTRSVTNACPAQRPTNLPAPDRRRHRRCHARPLHPGGRPLPPPPT